MTRICQSTYELSRRDWSAGRSFYSAFFTITSTQSIATSRTPVRTFISSRSGPATSITRSIFPTWRQFWPITTSSIGASSGRWVYRYLHSRFLRQQSSRNYQQQSKRSMTPNHSVEPTHHGKPCYTAHLGRYGATAQAPLVATNSRGTRCLSFA